MSPSLSGKISKIEHHRALALMDLICITGIEKKWKAWCFFCCKALPRKRELFISVSSKNTMESMNCFHEKSVWIEKAKNKNLLKLRLFSHIKIPSLRTSVFITLLFIKEDVYGRLKIMWRNNIFSKGLFGKEKIKEVTHHRMPGSQNFSLPYLDAGHKGNNRYTISFHHAMKCNHFWLGATNSWATFFKCTLILKKNPYLRKIPNAN